MMHKFLSICTVGLLGVSLLNTMGCSRETPVQASEEWRGSYRLISGTSGSSPIDVANPPQGTPRHVILTAAAAEYGTAVFVYNPPLAAPPMESVTYEKTVRHYSRTGRATRDQLRVEYNHNNHERLRLATGKFYIVQAGPRLPLVGELGNNIGNLTRSAPPKASQALNQPNTLVRVLVDPDANANTTVLGNGRVRISIPGGQKPDNRSFENRNNRSALFFQSPWTWEDSRPYRMLMWIQDGNGVRYGAYAPSEEMLAELGENAPPPSGTWVLQDAHLNGSWMDAADPFPSIPASLNLQWTPILERRSPRNNMPTGHEPVAGIVDPLINNGVIIEDGLVEITFSTPITFTTHADEARFFNSRAGYVIQNGTPVLTGTVRGSSSDGMSLTRVNAGDVEFSKEGDILTMTLTQGGKSYTLEYKQLPVNPQELEGFGDDSIIVKPVPAELF
jgi:hypothetical protein